jgi:hypothetical protein
MRSIYEDIVFVCSVLGYNILGFNNRFLLESFFTSIFTLAYLKQKYGDGVEKNESYKYDRPHLASKPRIVRNLSRIWNLPMFYLFWGEGPTQDLTLVRYLTIYDTRYILKKRQMFKGETLDFMSPFLFFCILLSLQTFRPRTTFVGIVFSSYTCLTFIWLPGLRDSKTTTWGRKTLRKI